MLEIGNAVVSLDIIDSKFSCDLSACKGACCVSGDSGAPLEPEEADILQNIFPVLRKYLSAESVKSIEEQGTSVTDMEQELVTPLNSGRECAYVYFEKGIALCAIEKAYNEGAVGFRKPLSCHLYPVRIKKYRRFEAVNYDRWEICHAATIKGDRLKMPVYLFTRDALERKYGSSWFQQLIDDARNLSISRGDEVR
jgi:hypothetical protein